MKYLIALIALFFASGATARTLTVDPKRTIVINKVVTGDILQDAGTLIDMADISKDPIYIVINSPGGAVFPGLQFITAMQIARHRGIKLHCVVPVMAASMGFQILVNCNYRYAFEHSLLLWHPMKIAGLMSLAASDCLYIGKELTKIERPLIVDIIKSLKITKRQFYYHYRHETMWTAGTLKKMSPNFLIQIDDIRGVTGFFNLR